MSQGPEAPSTPKVRRFLALPADEGLLAAWARAEGLLDEPFDAFYSVILDHTWIDLAECQAAVDQLRHAVAGTLSPRDRARLDRLEAHVRKARGELSQAVALYERADRTFVALRDRRERGRCAVGWIDALVQWGRFEEARALADGTLRRLPREDVLLRTKILFNRAACHKILGKWELARRTYLRVLALVRPYGAPELLIPPLYSIATLHREIGEASRSRAYYRELLEVGERSGNKRAIYGARMGLNLLEWIQGDWAVAARRAEEIERGLEEIGDYSTLAISLYRRSQILAALGAPERAEPVAARAYRLGREKENLNLTATTAVHHGHVLSQLGRFHDAARRFQEAGELFREKKDRTDERLLGLIRGEVLLDRGHREEAARLLRPLLRTRQGESRAEQGAMARGLLAEIHLARGRPALALRLAREAHRRGRGIRARSLRPRFALTVAQALSRLGRHREAVRWLRRTVAETLDQQARLGELEMLRETAPHRARLHRRMVEVAWASGGEGAPRLALDLLARLRSSSQVAELLRGGDDGDLRQLRTTITRLRDEALPTQGRRAAVVEGEIARLENRLEKALARQRVNGSARPVSSDWSASLPERRLVLVEEDGEGWCAYVADSPRQIRRVRLPEAADLLRRVWLPQRLLFEAVARSPRAEREELLERTRGESWDALRRLHAGLWAPLELDDRPVDLVASGALHGLPLEALPWVEAGVPRPAVSRLPHPGVRRILPRRRPGPALLLGDGGRGVQREVEAIRRRLRAADVPVRTSRRRNALQAVPALGLLHVAAHGVFHRRHWLLSGIRLEDGWLGFEQLRESPLQGALLFLSSCESGMAHDLPGSEMDGWLAAGLAAGVSEMVLALWKVDDVSAGAFSRRFYELWTRGLGAAAAAARTREDLLADGHHPWQWAPWLAMS